AVAIISIELVLAEIRDEQILEAIVVIIANANAGCPAGIAQAGFFSHIRKGSVAIIFIQTIGGPWRSAFDLGATKYEDVHPAIIVVVEESTAAACRFKN